MLHVLFSSFEIINAMWPFWVAKFEGVCFWTVTSGCGASPLHFKKCTSICEKNHNHVKINMTFNHTVKYSIVRGFPRLFCSWMKSLTGYLHTIFTAWLGVLQLEIDGWRRDRHCHFFWPAKQPSQEVSKQISHLICGWNRSQLAWSEVIKDFCNWKMSLVRSDKYL